MEDQFLNQEGRLNKFYAEHGKEFVLDIDFRGAATGWRLFADGAMMASGGVMQPPPTDPYEAAKLVLQYHETKLRLAVGAFNSHKNELLMMTRRSRMNTNPRSPLPSEKEKLLELQKEALKLKVNVERAKAKMESYKPPQIEAREESEQLAVEEIAKARSEIESIEV